MRQKAGYRLRREEWTRRDQGTGGQGCGRLIYTGIEINNYDRSSVRQTDRAGWGQ